MHRARALPECGSETVGTGVTTTDDDDVAAFCIDGSLEVIALLDPVRARQVVHCLVHTGKFASWNGKVTCLGGSAGQDDGVVIGLQLLHRKVHPHCRVGSKLRALGLHLSQPPVQVALFHLELGNPVPQQAPDPVGALEYHHAVSSTGELLCRCQACRSGAHHGYTPASVLGRYQRGDPAFGPCPVDDAHLDLLDGHRGLVDAEHTGPLTRCRTEPAGELREVVRGVESIAGLAPVITVDQVVPVGYEVPQGAALVAERYAAVHAPAGLMPEGLFRKRLVDLPPVAQTDRYRTPVRQLPVVLQESPCITHVDFLGPGGGHDRLHLVTAGVPRRRCRLHHPLVVGRHHLGEPLRFDRPVGQQPLGDC